MAFENSVQTGSQSIASTQLAQQYFVDTSVANYLNRIPLILTRGAPRIMVLAEQTIGAVAATLQVEVCVSNVTAANPLARLQFEPLGTPILTPFGTPIVVERAIPTKYIRVVPVAQGGNNVTVRISVMAAQ
jgi:hypothetical protein